MESLTEPREKRDKQSDMRPTLLSSTAAPLLEGPQCAPSIPSTWQSRRLDAWKKFESLPMPSRKDEDWRFANLAAIKLEPYHTGIALTPDQRATILESSLVPFEQEAIAILANEEVLQAPPLPSKLKEAGVLWMPLSEAVISHPDLLAEHFMAGHRSLGSEKLSTLHQAFSGMGYLLHVPKGVVIEKPLVVFHWLAGENTAVFPHTLILAEANSRCAVVDVFRSLEARPGFASVGCDLHLAAGSKVHHIAVQDWSEQTLAFSTRTVQVQRDAESVTLNANFGSSFTRAESRSRLEASGARSQMLSLSIAHGTQEIDQRTVQDHVAPHTWSDLLYKNALNHRSKCIFQGLIKVEPTARLTDAYQTNRNLLLSSKAEADSMPGLEIENDDVKCSHGATTGQVDPEEMFYLLARGIPHSQAYRLLVIGFFQEVVDRMEMPAVADYLHGLIEKKFQLSDDLQLSENTVESLASDETNVRGLQGTE